MADANTKPEKSFVLQKQIGHSSRQPLEVHHLSHDLRGPLNSILGFAELLKEGIEGPLNDIQIEDVSAIYQSAQILLRLINTIVALSKLEAGNFILNLQPVALNTAAEKVVAADFGEGKPNQVGLVSDVSESFPQLFADSDRLQEMIFNLVKFALKISYVKEIRLTAGHDESDAILQITAVGGFMAPDELEELFELAVNIDDGGRSKLSKGGLEMPLVHGLAKAHQGQVWVENQADVGTIFFLRLPLHQLK